jgi:hypothetical protein
MNSKQFMKKASILIAGIAFYCSLRPGSAYARCA